MARHRPRNVCRADRLALLLFSGLCLIAPSAQASNWEMLYRLSDRMEGSDNISQIVNSPGWAGSNNASAGLDINLITRSLTWGLTADIGYLTYFGNTDLENVPSKSVKSDLEKKTKDTDYFLSASYSIAPVSNNELTDLGILKNSFERLNYGASAGFGHRINSRDGLNFEIGVSRSDFTDTGPNDDVTPNRSVTASLIWTREFNQRVSGNLKTSVNWYVADDPLNQTEFLIYKNTIGTKARLTRRFSITANAGAALIDDYKAIPPNPGREREIVYGFIGDFSFEYKPFNNTTFGFSLSQDVFTDDLGDLRASQSAAFSLGYKINEVSRFDLSGGLSLSTGGEEDTGPSREFWNISPIYSHQINKRWNSAIGYRFVQSNDTDAAGGATPVTSNTVFISLSTSGALLP